MSSIYIPFVNCDADETFMGAVLGLAKLGEIERIDFVMDRQQQRRSAYVHFVDRCEGTGFWSDAFRGALDRGECVKIFYDRRGYWKCIKSRAKKPTHELPTAPEKRLSRGFRDFRNRHPQWSRQQDGTLVFGFSRKFNASFIGEEREQALERAAQRILKEKWLSVTDLEEAQEALTESEHKRETATGTCLTTAANGRKP